MEIESGGSRWGTCHAHASSFYLSLHRGLALYPSCILLHGALTCIPSLPLDCILSRAAAMTSSTAQMLAQIECGTALQVGPLITQSLGI